MGERDYRIGIGAIVQALRLKVKATQMELAERAGLGKEAWMVSKLETAKWAESRMDDVLNAVGPALGSSSDEIKDLSRRLLSRGPLPADPAARDLLVMQLLAEGEASAGVDKPPSRRAVAARAASIAAARAAASRRKTAAARAGSASRRKGANAEEGEGEAEAAPAAPKRRAKAAAKAGAETPVLAVPAVAGDTTLDACIRFAEMQLLGKLEDRPEDVDPVAIYTLTDAIRLMYDLRDRQR